MEISIPKVYGETQIISLTPSSGYVGTTIQLSANINTENGIYLIKFDDMNITSENASNYEVKETFEVPNTFAGNHTIFIIDVETGERDNATFKVLTLYSIETVPKQEPPRQYQEGDQVQFLINVTGGDQGKTFVSNVTVQTPTGASYTQFLPINISNEGIGSSTIIYPDDFSAEANTNFTGEYNIFLNSSLAIKTVFIGLTNTSEYHRSQVVDIKAVYKPNENVTLTIFGNNVYHSVTLMSDSMGKIHYTSWSVSSNASIGVYTISLTSTFNQTQKEPEDKQNFTVPGFTVTINLKNLAGNPVKNVKLSVYEGEISIANKTSNADGAILLMLEIGNYVCDAFFKDSKVGDLGLNITESSSWDLYCNLTNLRIIVTDSTGHAIPQVKLSLTPESPVSFTDLNGIAVIPSLLSGIDYVLNASRYDALFNITTIPLLPLMPWFNLTITCPTLSLQINVLDSNGNPIDNATIKVGELMGGLYYEGNTVEGVATLHGTFGKYKVKIFSDDIELNETSITLFQNKNVSIYCKHYALTVSFKIFDYFGQPIPNSNITLDREGLLTRSQKTENDGIATFNNVIGGNLQIAVYLNNQKQPSILKTFFVGSSRTLNIRLETYVIVFGFLLHTSQLATIIIVIATFILFFLIDVYRRWRLKHDKTSEV
jgi:hypothetical protein